MTILIIESVDRPPPWYREVERIGGLAFFADVGPRIATTSAPVLVADPFWPSSAVDIAAEKVKQP